MIFFWVNYSPFSFMLLLMAINKCMEEILSAAVLNIRPSNIFFTKTTSPALIVTIIGRNKCLTINQGEYLDCKKSSVAVCLMDELCLVGNEEKLKD